MVSSERKFVVAGLLVLGFIFVTAFPNSVAAINGSSLGGNPSALYQPTTQNPQNNPSSSLQLNSADLQPISGQPGVDEQKLPNVSDLQVVGSNGPANPNTTSATVADDYSSNGSNSWMVTVGEVLLVVIILYAIYAASKKGQFKQETPVVDSKAEAELTELRAKAARKKSKVNSPKHSKKRRR
ncbi:MAG: hypothetical protein ABI354_03620 [Candidatus Saccharimonadales bacterium]